MKALRAVVVLLAATCAIAAGMPARAAEPHWPASIVIATASAGGTYHVYGAGLARILTRELGIAVAELPTEGTSENIELLESGKVQLGFVTMGAALQGWNGTGDWTRGRQFRSMRALFPMYDTPFTFAVARNSSIRALRDMQGKRLGVGPRGGTAGLYVPKFLATLKLDAEPVYGSYDDLAAQLRAGTIDVLAAAAGAPFPALAALDAGKRVRFVDLDRSEITALRLAMPELTASAIPAGSYPSLMKEYATVGLFNFAVSSRTLPEDLAYAIVDAVYRNHDELVQVHSAAAATVPANFSRNTFLPYHPGALRYYSNAMTRGTVQGD
ncbi:MAG TPA: TAXI family TRAP transporter solute-binding subunit [Burkholderiales bacterium]|nr:TAXI family TRAP transporter solute-binding subunit [Burkholderiales bacterium]